ncbi:MAG TPA: histidine triad nucleotide-binding protein [Gemmatimonadaceae bacterium]|nr:histidine triad nucleotide-binding protein [Gemmatimonadaceae bacterium]
MPSKCLFCRIVSGDIPADILAERDDAIVFRDINAQAPSHMLVIPRRHVESLDDADDAVELGELLRLAAEVARDEGLADSGYRVVINTNDDGGQTVRHLHLHVLGGRRMTWPPG